MSTHLEPAASLAAAARPRLGFLGVGWIGQHRLQALAESGAGQVAAVADPSTERRSETRTVAPGAAQFESFDQLLAQDLDGIVIATPSAMHAAQCITAFDRGLAVFCQKPLARNAAETRNVVDAARAADRLLGIDLSYRYTAAMRAVRDAVTSGAVGDVYAVDLVFHNAWGPDRGWARDPALAGGGCVIDLGIHLVDLALWVLDFPAVRTISSQCYARGQRLAPSAAQCEDFANATIELDNGATVRMTCSWESSTGQDAVIEAAFHGTEGGVAMRNINGSFYDFTAELYRGTVTTLLAAPPDAWGGRALVEWSRRLGAGARFDPEVERLVTVAATLDGVLGR
jgi:predicted dehydrogenase